MFIRIGVIPDTIMKMRWCTIILSSIIFKCPILRLDREQLWWDATGFHHYAILQSPHISLIGNFIWLMSDELKWLIHFWETPYVDVKITLVHFFQIFLKNLLQYNTENAFFFDNILVVIQRTKNEQLKGKQTTLFFTSQHSSFLR